MSSVIKPICVSPVELIHETDSSINVVLNRIHFLVTGKEFRGVELATTVMLRLDLFTRVWMILAVCESN